MANLFRPLTLTTVTLLLVLTFSSEPVAAATKKVTSNARSSVTAVTRAAKPAPTNCAIKGNISKKTREKIYHVSGCPNYRQTTIDRSAGERLFCTEKEAQDAGWRKALNCPR